MTKLWELLGRVDDTLSTMFSILPLEQIITIAQLPQIVTSKHIIVSNSEFPTPETTIQKLTLLDSNSAAFVPVHRRLTAR